MYICVAGKNNIAVDCTDFLLSENIFAKENILVCFNRTDTGEDSFQRSFKNYSQQLGLRDVSLDDLLGVGDLMFISLEYDRIVPTSKFKNCRLYNIHFSLLPKYKGMYTSAWPILNGETHSGVTLHEIDEGIDTGDIVDQIEFEIHYDDNCRDLYLKYIHHGTLLFKRNIHNLVSGQFSAKRQPASGSSYYSRKSIDYSNVKIKLNKTAFEIRNQIRAFNFKEYQVPKVLGFDIVSADILESKSCKKPGSIIDESEGFVDIATVDYDLRLFKNRDQRAR